MVFSSIPFLVYFLPMLLLLYVLTPRKLRNWLLLAASILFYSWGAPRFIFVILGTTLLDFMLVARMDRSRSEGERKLILVLSLCMNLGLLFYFKYCNFFIDSFNAALGAAGFPEIPLLNVVLPIGISFYTFESLTYVIDVYRRVHAPLRNFWNYQLYIIFFPKLIAGPIVKYHEIADQLSDRRANDNLENKIGGLYRFVIGLSKKIFIANQMAVYADLTFDAEVQTLTAATAWVGVLAYTFQIYFDFSGYSDMAIGLSRMFGFVIPENFDNPYTSGSITEFWRRWHISLGRWMREYLYIPLGGNRVNSQARLYFNLWFVFLASGLWHGAAWTFVVWGAYHGVFLVLERMFLLRVYKRMGALSIALTFFIVVIGWIFFRAGSLEHAGAIITKLFSGDMSLPFAYFDNAAVFFFILAVFFSFFRLIPVSGERIQQAFFFPRLSPARLWTFAPLFVLLLVVATAAVAALDFNPFIYFRF